MLKPRVDSHDTEFHLTPKPDMWRAGAARIGTTILRSCNMYLEQKEINVKFHRIENQIHILVYFNILLLCASCTPKKLIILRMELNVGQDHEVDERCILHHMDHCSHHSVRHP